LQRRGPGDFPQLFGQSRCGTRTRIKPCLTRPRFRCARWLVPRALTGDMIVYKTGCFGHYRSFF
jgi:hypothetical protein